MFSSASGVSYGIITQPFNNTAKKINNDRIEVVYFDLCMKFNLLINRLLSVFE